MDYQQALLIAETAVSRLVGHTIDAITVKRPGELQGAVELAKIVSKLSPIVGNLMEYAVVQYLNTSQEWPAGCQWIRQDPDFPDAILAGMPYPQPGIEIKTWFPLATEITARFHDTERLLLHHQTKVAIVSWLPEHIIAGQPKIIGVWIGDALEVARTRDNHYHNPPSYIVMEPEDTRERTRNLQQTNCTGHAFQGTPEQLAEAHALVASWGREGRTYSPHPDYQVLLRELRGRFSYRLDTNFGKMDRIALPSLEVFKQQMLNSTHKGRTVSAWVRAVSRGDRRLLADLVDPDAPTILR